MINSPVEILEINIKSGENKAVIPLVKMIFMGIMAGAFIAIGGAASSTAMHGIADVGVARTLAGTIFPVGLMLVVLMGGELFTGDCLMITALLDKKISWMQMIRVLVIVYFSNLLGSLLIDSLLVMSGNLDLSGGMLGAFAIKTAVAKVGITPLKAVTSGILCNILVCFAVLMAAAAKDIIGKIWAVFFPIWAFVICGFEHCVANMFYIPTGMMAAVNPDYVLKAQEVYGITAAQIESLSIRNSLWNFVPVTIGNIIGGMIFVGVPMYMIQKSKMK